MSRRMLAIHVLDKRYLGKEKLLGRIHILIVTESLKLGQVCQERGCE